MRLEEAKNHLTEVEYQRDRSLDACFFAVIADQAEKLSLTDKLTLTIHKGQNGETSLDVLIDDDNLAISISSCPPDDDRGYLYTLITSATVSGGWHRNQTLSQFWYDPKFPVISINIGLTSILADNPDELHHNTDLARVINLVLRQPYKRLGFQSVGRY